MNNLDDSTMKEFVIDDEDNKPDGTKNTETGVELFDSIEEIEIFNKKAIYLYLREITGLNTKQIVNSLKKFRKRYFMFKTGWQNGDL